MKYTDFVEVSDIVTFGVFDPANDEHLELRNFYKAHGALYIFGEQVRSFILITNGKRLFLCLTSLAVATIRARSCKEAHLHF